MPPESREHRAWRQCDDMRDYIASADRGCPRRSNAPLGDGRLVRECDQAGNACPTRTIECERRFCVAGRTGLIARGFSGFVARG